MLKELLEVVEEMEISLDTHGRYAIVATCFTRLSGPDDKPIRVEMPMEFENLKETERHDKPVLEISEKAHASKICLIVEEPSGKKNKSEQSMTFKEFLKRVKSIKSDFNLVSSARGASDKSDDCPIMAVFVDNEKEKICFIETP